MKELHFALIGGGFMGKAHSLGLASLPMYVWPPAAMPQRTVIAEATPELAETARQRFGFARGVVGWQEVVADPEVEVVDILLPNNMHREVVLAALGAGKHVICEKPLGLTGTEAKELWEAARASGLKHQVGFNWRLAPAVQMARRLIDDGALGAIRSFRGYWLADFGLNPDAPLTWRHQKAVAGYGTLGDLGSHVIDMARYLVDEISEVCGYSEIVVKERPVPGGTGKKQVDVDDNTAFMLRFENGAFGYMEATQFSPGRSTHIGFEVYGERGAITFVWERMNELQFYSSDDPADRQGFRTIFTGPAHPFGEFFWPIPAYQIGYAETKMLQLNDMVTAVATGGDVQTSFYDGWKNCQVLDAVVHSADERAWVAVKAG